MRCGLLLESICCSLRSHNRRVKRRVGASATVAKVNSEIVDVLGCDEVRDKDRINENCRSATNKTVHLNAQGSVDLCRTDRLENLVPRHGHAGTEHPVLVEDSTAEEGRQLAKVGGLRRCDNQVIEADGIRCRRIESG
jgi:hypothetical protein